MAGNDNDRLSSLADDLLRRILYFVPFKEAASTSVLSRRWGSLWRSSGAVNLDVRINNGKRGGGHGHRQGGKKFFSHRDAFVRAAMAAFDAADARITSLTLRVENPTGDEYATDYFLHRTSGWRAERDVVGDVVSHSAALHVEELRVAVVNGREEGSSFASNKEEPTKESQQGRYNLSSLPSMNLRVLDLTGCGDLPATNAMPRLETLRLRDCSVNSGDLQALMDAAPGLANMHLESVFFSGTEDKEPGPGVCLRCRAVTELVLEFCGMEGQSRYGSDDRGSMGIDAPRLRYFRYKGSERRFSLTSPAPDMVVLELHFLQGRYHRQGDDYDPDRTRVPFWQFVRNFTNARVLKLKVNHLKDIAVGKARRTELLCTFSNAMRLEVEGAHDTTKTKAAAVAIANLLRCCPAARESGPQA